MSKKDWQLLKAYQATGLTPEGVEALKKELEWKDKVIELAQRTEAEVRRERNELLDLAPMDELCECCVASDCDNCDVGSRWKLQKQEGKDG